jgi:hypothetical protein
VEAASFATGTTLSPAVAAAMDDLVAAALEELGLDGA